MNTSHPIALHVLLSGGREVGRRYGPAAPVGDEDDGGAEAGRRGGPRSAVVVCVDPAYRKGGNVQMLCQRYGVELVHEFEELAGAVMTVLESIRE